MRVCAIEVITLFALILGFCLSSVSFLKFLASPSQLATHSMFLWPEVLRNSCRDIHGANFLHKLVASPRTCSLRDWHMTPSLACQDLIESGTQGAHLATEHRSIARTGHRQLPFTGKFSLASVSVCAYILLCYSIGMLSVSPLPWREETSNERFSNTFVTLKAL